MYTTLLFVCPKKTCLFPTSQLACRVGTRSARPTGRLERCATWQQARESAQHLLARDSCCRDGNRKRTAWESWE